MAWPVLLLRSKVLPRLVLVPFRRQFSVAARSLSKESDVDHEVFRFGEDNAPSYYHRFLLDKEKKLQERLQDPGRFQHVNQREERSVISRDTWKATVSGKYFCFHRGMDIFKVPADMMVYSQLFWHVRPRTLIELGACTGASAIWMADVLKVSKIDCKVYSVDLDLSLLQAQAKELQPSHVTFMEGDCEKIETIFPADFLAAQPHPWVVIDDAHDGMEVVLDHFDHYFTPGDYFICEDTNPYGPLSSGGGSVYEEYEESGVAKLHAWKRALAKHGDKYAIDTFFNDLFGYNSTSNWDGFVRRMK